MRYKSDYPDKDQETGVQPSMQQAAQQPSQQYMPTCGAFNGGLQATGLGAFNSGLQATSFGGFQPVPQSTMTMGATQQPSTFPAAPMPTGYPTGGTASPLVPTAGGMPSTVAGQGVQGASVQSQVPTTVESPLFTPGFLRTQIGRRVRVEFLIGTNGFTDRTGTLVAVGASYILLRPIDSDDLMMCDIYSIKFVTIIL